MHTFLFQITFARGRHR